MKNINFIKRIIDKVPNIRLGSQFFSRVLTISENVKPRKLVLCV
jgi:hypothetical protein